MGGSRLDLPELLTVVVSGIQTLIWAGDRNWICDGGLASTEPLTDSSSAAFKKKIVNNYTANGVMGGSFKSEGNLSWLRGFRAGPEVCVFSKQLTCAIEKRGSEDTVPVLLFVAFPWEG